MAYGFPFLNINLSLMSEHTLAIEKTLEISAYMRASFAAKLQDRHRRVEFPEGWTRSLLEEADWMVEILQRAFLNKSRVSKLIAIHCHETDAAIRDNALEYRRLRRVLLDKRDFTGFGQTAGVRENRSKEVSTRR